MVLCAVVSGLAESQVHVTQAHKGVKPEQEPYTTPPHSSLHASDEDPLATPHQSPRGGLESMQLGEELTSAGPQAVKAENSELVTACACLHCR